MLQKAQLIAHHIMHNHTQTPAQEWLGHIVHFDLNQSISTDLKSQLQKVKDTTFLSICIPLLLQELSVFQLAVFKSSLQNKYEEAS